MFLETLAGIYVQPSLDFLNEIEGLSADDYLQSRFEKIKEYRDRMQVLTCQLQQKVAKQAELETHHKKSDKIVKIEVETTKDLHIDKSTLLFTSQPFMSSFKSDLKQAQQTELIILPPISSQHRTSSPIQSNKMQISQKLGSALFQNYDSQKAKATNESNLFNAFSQFHKSNQKGIITKKLDLILERPSEWDFEQNNYDLSDCQEDGGSNDKAHNFEFEEENVVNQTDSKILQSSTPTNSKSGVVGATFQAKKVAIRCNGKAIPVWARDMENLAAETIKHKKQVSYLDVFGVLAVINNLDVDRIFGTKNEFAKRGTSNQWATKSGITELRREKNKNRSAFSVDLLN